MSEVDERVVQMKFDNAQFEAGVQQTLQSLNKLNKSIDENTKANNGKSLTGLTNAVNKMSTNFDRVDKVTDVVTKKFSVLGTIGDQILRRIGDGAVNTAKKLVNMVNSPLEQIKSGGWSRASNINNARFQLNGLKIAWDSVNKDLQYAVNQTAYGLDSAANVASQLAASGIKIRDNIKLTSDNVDELAQNFKGMKSKALIANGSLDEMSVALRAISGVAAQTNSSYDDIGNVFARVAGQGRVMATDLNSLAARGMNAAATLGEALGKSESEIRDMVSKGEISFEIFSEAMYDAFADHAIDANNTFNGALANMKAALSKIGAEFFLPFLERVPKVFNALRESINDLKSDLMPFIKDINGFTAMLIDRTTDLIYAFKKSGMITDMVNTLEEAFYSVLLILHPIKDAFDAVFDSIGVNSFKGITGGIYSFIKAAHLSVNQMEALYKVSYAIFSIINVIGKVVTTVIGGALRLVKPLFNLLGSIAGLITDIFKAFTGSKSNNDLAKKLGKASRSVKELYLSGIDKVAGFINKFADAIRKINLSPFITKIKEGATAFVGWVKNLPIIDKLTSKLSKTTKGATNVFQGIAKVLSSLKEKFVAVITSIKNLPIVSRLVTDLNKAFTILGTIAIIALIKVASGIEKIVNSIRSIKLVDFNGILTNVVATLENLWRNFTGFFDSIKSGSGVLEAFKQNFEDLITRITKLKEKVVDAFKTITESIDGDKIKESLTGVIQKLEEFAKRITPAKVAAIALSTLFLAFAINISRVSGSLSKTLDGVNGVFDALTDTIGSFKKQHGSKILELAESLGILAVSLYVISKIPKDKLKSSMLTIASLAGVLAGLILISSIATALLGKMSGGKSSLFKVGAAIIAISGSILILAAAMKTLDGIKLSTELIAKLGVVSIAVAILSAIAMACAMVKTKSLKSVLVVAALAGAVWVISCSLEKLNKLDLNAAIKSLGILAIAIGSLAIISNVMGRVGIFSAIGIVLATVTLKKIVPMLNEIAKYDFSNITNKLKQNKKTMIILGGLIVAMGIVGKLCGKGLAGFGAGMILIMASVILMTKVVKKLAELDSSTIAKGTKALTKFIGLVAVLEILSFATRKSGMIKFATSLLIISGALLIMTGLTAILGSLNPLMINNGIKALSALVGLIAILEVCSAIAGRSGKSIKSVIALIISVSVLTGELVVLSLIPVKDLIAPLVVLGTILVLLSSLFKSLTALSKEGSAKAILSIITIMAAIGEITACLSVLADKPWDSLVAASVGLSLVMHSIGDLIKSMPTGKGSVSIKYFADIAAALGSVAVVAYALSMVAGYDWPSLLAASAGISLVMLSVGALMTVIGTVGQATVNVVGVIASLAGGLIALGIVAFALSKLCAYDWKSMLASAIAVSTTMLALSATAAIISVIPAAAAAQGALGLVAVVIGLTAIVGVLGYLYQNEGFKKVISDGGQALLKIGQAIGNFVGGIIGGIAEGVTSVLPQIASDLSTFAFGIQPFCTLMGSIDDSVFDGTANLAKAILALTGADVLSGFMELLKPFTGTKEGFADTLTVLGESISAYVKSISSLNDGDIDKINLSAEAASALIKVADAIPNSGGLLGKLVGNNDLDDFGSTLVPFGEGLVKYGAAVQGITPAMITGINNSVAAAKAIVDVADVIPNSGGLLGKLVGNNDIDDFGNTLVPFADGLVKFGSKCLTITSQMITSVDNAVQMTKKLSDLANSMENIGGVSGFFAGDNTLSNFGKTLSDFAGYLGTFATRYAAVDKEAISGVDTLIAKLVKAANSAASVSSDSFNGLKEALKTAGSEAVTQFVSSFTNSTEKVQSAVKNLILHAADNALNNGSKSKFKDLGKELAGAMAEGFSESLEFSNAVSLLVNGAINSINQNISKFRAAGARAGQAVIDGFEGDKGIDPGKESHKAHEAVDLIANGAENSVKENIQRYSDAGATGGSAVIDSFGKTISDKGKEVFNKYASSIDQYKALYGDMSKYGTEETNKSTSATTANTGVLDKNTLAKTGNAKASSKAAKATKQMTEEEKMLAKYTKYATATMNAYMDVTGATIGLISNTSPVKVAQEAMHELAEQIYADTQKDSGSVADATESAKDHAKAVMEAFNKAFESIRDNVKNSIDLFTKFDTKFDELTNPDVVLKNAESQIEGVTRLGQKYMLLAEKGFSREIISDLESKGVEGLSKVNSLLKMNTEQALEYNAVQKKIDDVSTSVAAQAMAAQASAITISKLRQQVEEQKKIKASAKDLWDEYSEEFNKAKDAGADLTKTVYGNIDMNNRQVLKWTKENLDKYHGILKDSMHMTEEDINDLSGNISTVLGSWGTYGEEGIAIAFSPMLQTDHGAELLDNKTINNYIDMLVDKVNAEHPNGWVNADLLALDKKGMEVDGKFIQNIIADIGDTAEATSEQMHYVGIDSDVMHSYSKLQEMADNLGISVEDLGKKCYDTGMTAQEAALNLIEIHQKASTILQTFQDKYEGMKNTVKDLIQSQVGLFEKLELKTDTSAQDMINNFKSQVDGLKQWSAEFQSLAARGINDGLLKELGKAGPEGYEKLHAFYTMSSSELQQINNLYAQRLTLEDTVAQQIGTSYATAAVGGIQAYNQAIVNYTASGVLMNTAIAAAQQISDTLNTNGKRGGTTAGTNTATSLQQALQNMIAPLRSTATNVSNQTNNATKSHLNNNTGNEIGTNYLQGLLNGISNGSLRDQIIGTISSLASDMNAAMHNGLKERSPSKFTEQAGENYFIGLLNGLKNTFNRPVDAVSDIAEQMNTTMQDALQTAVDLMNNSGDMQPTIRPVVDLSDAQNGSRLLSSMFSNIGPMRVNAGIGQITTPTDRMNAAIAGMSSGNSVTNGDTVLNIYATPGQNTKELADIVIKRLNNEYARRKAAWT